MLKFIKHHMTSIGGIEIYPLISFLIFFLFFLAVLVYVLKMSRESITELSNIPLKEDQSPENKLNR